MITVTKKTLALCVAAVVVVISGWVGVSNCISAEHWTACGASFSQGLGLELKYGEPTSLTCLLVAYNTAPKAAPIAPTNVGCYYDSNHAILQGSDYTCPVHN